MRGGSEYKFDGPVMPFEAMVEYHPISAKDMSRRAESKGGCLTKQVYSDTSTKAQIAEIMVQKRKSSRSFRTKSVLSPFGRTVVGQAI